MRSALALLVAACTVGALPAAAASVTGFILVDAGTDTDIGPLADGSTVDLDLVGDELNVRAEVTADVESVVFGLDSDPTFQVENVAPFALAGDSGGDYAVWSPSLGEHTLVATPYPADNAGGSPGPSLEVSFTVVRSPPECPELAMTTPTVSGTLELWHTVTLSFAGAPTSENASLNPFTDLRLEVAFDHPASGTRHVVPGFYAADGEAADTGADFGSTWQARFTPPRPGTWQATSSLRCGPDIAMADDASGGQPAAFDGASTSFVVGPSSAVAPDLRAHGRLEYVGRHHLRFSGSGRYWLKGGADSPENLLGYADFDNTADQGGSGNDLVDGLHRYAAHLGDWSEGDPGWGPTDRGRGLIGALNYLAGKGMNSVYFLTMNIGGDGREVYPWTGPGERRRFDVSKLEQWERVFAHMETQGIVLHVVTQETENDQLLDGGALGSERRLYYRELVARFGHHLGLVWNLGEENTNSDSERRDFADFIRSLDPWNHPIVVHTYPGSKEAVYGPLLGFANLEGPSLQMGSMTGTHDTTLEWRQRSGDATPSRPWFVCVDEIGPANTGVKPDADDPSHDEVRRHALWGNLMAGGSGAEWYFGYAYDHNDLDSEDWRSRDTMWDQTRYALELFHGWLPFWRMEPADQLSSNADHWVLAASGEIYAVYVPDASVPIILDLSGATGELPVRWYDPRAGGDLQTGSVGTVSGGGDRDLGLPPGASTSDWVVLVGTAGEVFADGFESGGTGAWSAAVP